MLCFKRKELLVFNKTAVLLTHPDKNKNTCLFLFFYHGGSLGGALAGTFLVFSY